MATAYRAPEGFEPPTPDYGHAPADATPEDRRRIYREPAVRGCRARGLRGTMNPHLHIYMER